MTTSQNDPSKPVMDEVDDLTRFLDEDFGTEEVDLFEFTSGEEESPLTQLKTIVLGLDWEITDETLQDLADEIDSLRNLEQFQHDKVSQVYLQALDKIGNYIYSEGAHAHHNSIKLLLSMFYDFEKIISSELITGAEITALLKSDVRKFKILQYQIAQKHGGDVPEAAAAAAELPITDHKTLLDIHAAILELDWDVTDGGLQRLSEELASLKEQFADNKYILIIIRGLETLTNYIDEERARAHPEAFSLFHHFFEALETLVDDRELDEERSQKLLINCVNRLNALKSLITQTQSELGEDAISPVQDETPAVKETIETAPPEDIAEPPAEKPSVFIPPPVVEEEEYVDELDVELPVDEKGEVAPALFDSEGEKGLVEPEVAEEAPSEELEEKLQFFFDDDEEAAPPPPPPEEETTEVAFEDSSLEEPNAEEVQEAEEAIPAEDISPFAPPTPKEEEEVDELDVELPVDDKGEVAPALFDSEEETGFAVTEEEVEAPSEELEEKLQFFFGSDEETFEPEAIEEAVAQKKAEEGELAAEALKEQEEEEEQLSITPALAGEPEEAGFTVEASEEVIPPAGLDEKLESFFDKEEAPETETGALVEEAAPDLTDEEVPEILFEEEDEDEEFLLTPALAADDKDEIIFDTSAADTLETISTPEEYNVAVEKIRTEFQEREKSLLDEINSLKQKIESLRS